MKVILQFLMFFAIPLHSFAQSWGSGVLPGTGSCYPSMFGGQDFQPGGLGQMPMQMPMPNFGQAGMAGLDQGNPQGPPVQVPLESADDLKEAKADLKELKHKVSALKEELDALNGSTCDLPPAENRSGADSSCHGHLPGWTEKQQELASAQKELNEAEARVKELHEQVKAEKAERREAQRNGSDTEGGCLECMLAARRGGGGQSSGSNSAMALSSAMLGIGSMLMSNQMLRYQTFGCSQSSMASNYSVPIQLLQSRLNQSLTNINSSGYFGLPGNSTALSSPIGAPRWR